MSLEEIRNNLDELLKIPQSQQKGEVIQSLQDILKENRNLFFDKAKPAEERNAVFDETNKIASYLGEKPLKFRIGVKGAGKKIRTDDEKKADIDNMLKHAEEKYLKVIKGIQDSDSDDVIKRKQIFAGQVFNKACENWISG